MLASFATPATAQDVADAQPADVRSQAEAPLLCAIYAVHAGEEARPQIRANCKGAGYILGFADSFVTSTNPRLNATLVELQLDEEVKLFLFRPGSDGKSTLENITADMAVSAGRAPWASLEGLAIDHSQFGADGSLQARGDAQNTTEREARPGSQPPGRLSVAEIIARDDERLAAAGIAAAE